MDEDEIAAVESGNVDALLAFGYGTAVATFIAALSSTNRSRAASLLKRDKRASLNRLGDLVAYQTAGRWPQDPVAVRALSALWFRDMDLPRRVKSAVGATRALSRTSAPSPSRQVSIGTLPTKALDDHYGRIRRAQTKAAVDLRDNLKRGLVQLAFNEIAWKPLTAALYRYDTADEGVEMILDKVKGRVQGVLLNSLGLAAETGAKQMLAEVPNETRLIDVFDALTPWAVNHSQRVGEDFAESVGKTFLQEADFAVRRNLTATELEKNLQRSFGLTPRQAGWVHNRIEALDYHAEQRVAEMWSRGFPMLDRVMPVPKEAASNLAKKLVASRIQALSNTETMIAFNYGRQLLLQSALDRGVLPPDTDKVWVTAIDERVCPVCGPMDSKRVRFEEQFVTKSGHVLVPPVHPNCRCTIIPSNIFDQGIITRSARAEGRNLTTDSDFALAKHFGPGLHPSGTPQAVHSWRDMKKLKGIRHGGRVELSSGFMDQFRVGMGKRAYNETYLRNLARFMGKHGFPGPVYLNLYEDGHMALANGHHRLESAHLAGLDSVPVKVFKIPGPRPPHKMPNPTYRNEERPDAREKYLNMGGNDSSEEYIPSWAAAYNSYKSESEDFFDRRRARRFERSRLREEDFVPKTESWWTWRP